VGWTLKLAAIRVEARTPSPSSFTQRSGAIVLDIHSINITNTPAPSQGLRFAEVVDSPSSANGKQEKLLAMVSVQRVCLGYSPNSSSKAAVFTSLGALASERYDHDSQLLSTNVEIRSGVKSSAAIIRIPGVFVDLNKETLDGLQFWADDAQQLVERALSHSRSHSNSAYHSRSGSMIGSRYFTQSQSGGDSTAEPKPASGGVCQATVTEGTSCPFSWG
jgi:autophagy-related protein 2